ncbi:hypothetical protein [Streptomyces sp. NPDC056169]|uniref:hypothetical protein n=1 Tax=Streptomyces sp. NPDC056169 TaxID=3345734 RepID=UPI0035DC9405
MLKMVDECGQVVFFAFLGVLWVLIPPWDGFWRWPAVAVDTLLFLGACRGARHAVRVWRKWRDNPGYSLTG